VESRSDFTQGKRFIFLSKRPDGVREDLSPDLGLQNLTLVSHSSSSSEEVKNCWSYTSTPSWRAQRHIYIYELYTRNSFVSYTPEKKRENTELHQQPYE